MSRKNIQMNPPLERLEEKYGGGKGRDGLFSKRLGDIIGRYEILVELTKTPDLTDVDICILSEVFSGSAIASGSDYSMSAKITLKYLPESIGDCTSGTEMERTKLAERASTWNVAEKIAILEFLKI